MASSTKRLQTQGVQSVKVLTASMQDREGTNSCHSISDSGEMYRIFWNYKEEPDFKIKCGHFYVLSDVRVNRPKRTITLTEGTSEVFDTPKFHYDDREEKQFFNEPVVSISEALSSPKKRRLSVQGIIQEVSSVAQAGNRDWSRRDVTLGCTSTKAKIMVKFWNSDIAHTETLEEGQEVVMKNFMTHEFNNTMELKCTNNCKVTVMENEKEAVIDVYGARKHESMAVLFTEDHEKYCLEKEIDEAIYNDIVSLLPMKMKVKFLHAGGRKRITSLTIVNDNTIETTDDENVLQTKTTTQTNVSDDKMP